MANNFYVTVIYGNEEVCKIDNDNPNLNALVVFISNLDTAFDKDKLLVACDDDSFDTDDLRNAIIESVADFKNKIAINDKAYDEAMKSVPTKANEGNSSNS